ncbi:hypothetical protein EV384_1881 [Micromonospora kangleipakensis]|uniref:Uncharacterized protein n=1 Tax=Micromonospora kangleipakensis TaxID=1077942 RepID=A0A4V2GCV2_9ACTN|nr:hypothetical protein [Micromonospora kangleipakensis]RZU73476.1 hypothetical protein EV384_1881 [Micromonospora kangleipakensis]
MSKPTRPSGLPTGLHLLQAVAGYKSAYTWADHEKAGLPMVVACTACQTTMLGASALIDSNGYWWYADCGDIRSAS